MKIRGIYLNWIVVKNIKEAVKFYTDVMGLTLRVLDENFGWAELSGPEGSLLGIAQENSSFEAKAGTNAVITITVDDIVSACKDLLKKGARLIGEVIEVPGEVKLQTVIDPDGNMLQVVEKLR